MWRQGDSSPREKLSLTHGRIAVIRYHSTIWLLLLLHLMLLLRNQYALLYLLLL